MAPSKQNTATTAKEVTGGTKVLDAKMKHSDDAFHECVSDNEKNSDNHDKDQETNNTNRRQGRLENDTIETRNGETTQSLERPALNRSLSHRLSRELRRRSSSVPESLPNTFSGWAALLSAVATATLGYEIHLQKSLTCPPLVYGQLEATKGSPNNSALDVIYRYMTRSPEAILSRTIQPSLFVGTRSVVASAAAFALGGPASTEDHLCFRQLLTMSQDGATIALDWELPKNMTTPSLSIQEQKDQICQGPIPHPVVLILHGINNDSSFGYIQSLLRTCSTRGWVGVGMNFRACGGTPMTTPRAYTGAYTGDLRCVVQSIAARLGPNVPLFLVGNSLGANLVTKYLGEEGLSGTLPECVSGGISLGNPLCIHSRHVAFPWDYLLSLGARKGILLNLKAFRPMKKSPQFQAAIRQALCANTIGEFDEAMAPIFIRNDPMYPFAVHIGYDDAESYWTDASSYRYVQHISVPLLQLTSQDDFLVHEGSHGKLSYSISNPNVMVVKTKCGGHLGWQECPPDTGSMFGFGTSWADTATADFIEAILHSRANTHSSSTQPPTTANTNENDKDQSTEHQSPLYHDDSMLTTEEAKLASSQLRARL